MNISLELVINALHKSWTKDTCYDRSDWSEDNPARGQCVVSSLVIQKYFGGELLRYKVTGAATDETHYCNSLADGTLVDATASQYTQPMTFEALPVNLKGYATVREKRLAEESTRSRYELLLSRVETVLSMK